MDKSDNIVYISYDADSAGRKIGQAVLNDDPDEMSRISERIKVGNDLFSRWAKERDGKQYSSGGDQGVYAIDKKHVEGLEKLRKDYHYLTGLTVSIGIGVHLSESGQALLMAKLKGKNQIVSFDKETKKEIQQIKKRVKKGKFKSMEEYKIAESYLDKSEAVKSMKKAESINNQKLEDATETANYQEKPEATHDDCEYCNHQEKPEATHDDCEYCNQTDGIDPNHCEFCHDAETAEGEEPCEFCDSSKELNNPEACEFCNSAETPEGEEPCKFCSYDEPVDEALDFPELAEQDDEFANAPENQGYGENVKTHPDGLGTSPDSNNDQAPAGSPEEHEQYEKMGMTPPMIGKPTSEDHAPLGQNAPMAYGAAPESANEDPDAETLAYQDPRAAEGEAAIDPEDNHSKEALLSIASEIENDGNPPAHEADSIDDTQITNDRMEGNTSRPDGFEQNTPSDMGTAGPNNTDPNDNEPDFYGVLEEGLNHDADGIQKEKAIKSVSQALMQFKGCKDMLEQSKAQMPQLYQASISMLKAMIEMATMLGLGQSGAGLGQESGQNSELGQTQESLMPEQPEQSAQPQQENDWHEPFPTHPDQGGEAKPGHAPSSNEEEDSPSPQSQAGSVGTPIGKLSAKHTTEHVARNPMPIGAINVSGQQKVMDDQGKIRFIDRKQGLVMGPSGVPVKPPKMGNEVSKNR